MGTREHPPADLIRGTLDMLILKTVSREPMHGYTILEQIERTSDRVFQVDEGALYPALHRLEVRGLLRSSWGVSSNNRRAKYYSLTADGRRALEREAASWNRVAGAIARIMQTA
jgi:PadR family transcriptional regulator